MNIGDIVMPKSNFGILKSFELFTGIVHKVERNQVSLIPIYNMYNGAPDYKAACYPIAVTPLVLDVIRPSTSQLKIYQTFLTIAKQWVDDPDCCNLALELLSKYI